MIVWVDAQFSPEISSWLSRKFKVNAIAVRDIGLRDATDRMIFAAARNEKAVIMSKDADFLDLVTRLGAPPQIIWITCGNTSNEALKAILERTFPEAREILESGEPLVEIAGNL